MGLFSSIAGAVTDAAGSILGGAISDKRNQAYANATWQKNYNAQKEFAQNSIQWRVQDAKKAGIHPLYAMGQTPGYTPSDSSYSSSYGEGVSRAMNRLGQAMGQLDFQLKKEEVKSARAEREGKELDNAVKVSNLAQVPKAVDTISNNAIARGQGSGFNILPDQFDSDFTGAVGDAVKLSHTLWNEKSANGSIVPSGYRLLRTQNPITQHYNYKVVPNEYVPSFWERIGEFWDKANYSVPPLYWEDVSRDKRVKEIFK